MYLGNCFPRVRQQGDPENMTDEKEMQTDENEMQMPC